MEINNNEFNKDFNVILARSGNNVFQIELISEYN